LFQAEIESWISDGQGLCRIDGMAVFVAGGVPGDRCEIRILKALKSHAYAKIERLSEPSPLRAEASCATFGRCGSCDLGHITYPAELEMKRSVVRDAFRRLGGIELDIPPVLGSPRTSGYRNKAVYQIRFVGGEPALGFFRKNSHDLIKTDSCELQPPRTNFAASVFLDAIKRFNLSIYDERTGKGDIRWLFYRCAEDGTGQMCIVSARDCFGDRPEITDYILNRCPFLSGILLSINAEKGNVAMKGEISVLHGSAYLADTLCGFKLEISPLSFYQINHAQTERLYSTVMDFAGLTGNETVLDLYCGIGTISLCLAAKARRVVGAEIVERAISDANRNAGMNNIDNIEFICADSEAAAGKMLREGEKFDVVVVDPPRKGLSGKAVDEIMLLAPKRIVYVSCDPATLARDLKLFGGGGYEVVRVQPVDMFPRTTHVETVVLLFKLKSTTSIEVKIDLDEMDLTKSESKALLNGITII
jgi:23S rRNA (uracil1939-C5)-methyltransferase